MRACVRAARGPRRAGCDKSESPGDDVSEDVAQGVMECRRNEEAPDRECSGKHAGGGQRE